MEGDPNQPSLLEPEFALPAPAPSPTWAAVAQVAVDSPLPHLDRLFDYGIPPEMAEDARVGSRVSVRFAGRILDGFIVAISSDTRVADLKPIRRIIGPCPVVTPDVLELSRALAQRYAGGLSDVLRLAVPPRHARAEKRVLSSPATSVPDAADSVDDTPWRPYQGGEAFLQRLAQGQSPRAVWAALPDAAAQDEPPWAAGIRAAVQATLRSGRGVLVLVPTVAELEALTSALAVAGIGFGVLTADVGPEARYQAYMECLLGHHRVIVGTRATAYAPVPDLGLVVCWDELHDAYNEPRAPYPHSRETLALRASLAGAGALFAGYARSPQAAQFISSGWAQHLGAPRAIVRERTPRIILPDEHDRDREGAVGHARIPSFAWRRIRQTLDGGPVLFQVPRAGFAPGLACARCRHTARCRHCRGPLAQRESGNTSCTWCARPADGWECAHCHHDRLRARTVGAARTADELGRAFPGVPVRVSGGGAGRLETVANAPALIIATPGAEPPAAGGYPLTVLLDGGLLTDRPFLAAPITALHRWLRAAALTAGDVILLGNPLTAPAQAAVRWDPAGYAHRELLEWTDLGFPPSHTIIAISGERPDVLSLVRYLRPLQGVQILGPITATADLHRPQEGELAIPVRTPHVRLLLRVPSAEHVALATAVRSAVRTRSAHRDGKPVQVRVNPTDEL